jgi:hypothetical protein
MLAGRQALGTRTSTTTSAKVRHAHPHMHCTPKHASTHAHKCTPYAHSHSPGEQHGTRNAVYFSSENDCASSSYTKTPWQGGNAGYVHLFAHYIFLFAHYIPYAHRKVKAPNSAFTWKVNVRYVHGLGIFCPIGAPWLRTSGNPDFVCTALYQSFLAIEKLGRLPRKWCEHSDGGDGNWRSTTFLFFGYLVETGIFDEIIFSR